MSESQGGSGGMCIRETRKKGPNGFTPPALGFAPVTVESAPASSVAESPSSTTRHHAAGPAPVTASIAGGHPPTAAR